MSQSVLLIAILIVIPCLQARHVNGREIVKRQAPPAAVLPTGFDEFPFFNCSDGRNIPKTYVCDFEFDCPFGEDEINCPDQDQYHCKDSSKTVPLKWVCDVIKDCPDGDDEENCAESSPTRYTCRDGSQNIRIEWVCDDYADCPDGDDEEEGCSEEGTKYPILCDGE